MFSGRLRCVRARDLADLPALGGPAWGAVEVSRAESADALWGFSGCVYAGGAVVRDRPVTGVLLLSAATLSPAVVPFSADAAVVAELRVAGSESARRVARDLVRLACARLSRAPGGTVALEAAPAYRYPPVPGSLLSACGFAPTSRPGVLRLELASTNRVAMGLDDLRNRLGELIRQPPPVEPARRAEQLAR